MSRRLEILQRAQAEFQAAIDRGREMRGEVLRQQRDLLATHTPQAKNALDAFESAAAEAFDNYQRRIAESQDKAIAAEAEATDAQTRAELDAIAQHQQAIDTATRTRDEVQEEAERIFEEAFRGVANQLFGAAKDKAIAGARSRRDAAIQAAERAFTKSGDDAFRKQQRDIANSREAQIAAFEKARKVQVQADQRASTDHESEIEKASQAFQKSVSGDPTAAAIVEAFELRLAEVERETEQEKADILARMRADIEKSTP